MSIIKCFFEASVTVYIVKCQTLLACLGTFHSTAPQGSFSIPDTDAMAEALVLDHNLSILASDPETGTLQCVMLNGVFHRDEIDMPRQEVDIENNIILSSYHSAIPSCHFNMASN